MKMAVSLAILERRARYVMGIVAVAALAGLGAFKMDWISTVPSYKQDAWYLVGGSANVIVTKEFQDESACRRRESASSVCRTGKTLMDEARSNQHMRS
jgi:hypothetical protein